MTAEQAAQLISLLIGAVLPLLVGLVTNQETNPAVRAVLLLALAAVTGFLSTLLGAINGHQAFDLFTAVITALGTFISGVGLHFGFWKPTGTSDRALSALTRGR